MVIQHNRYLQNARPAQNIYVRNEQTTINIGGGCCGGSIFGTCCNTMPVVSGFGGGFGYGFGLGLSNMLGNLFNGFGNMFCGGFGNMFGNCCCNNFGWGNFGWGGGSNVPATTPKEESKIDVRSKKDKTAETVDETDDPDATDNTDGTSVRPPATPPGEATDEKIKIEDLTIDKVKGYDKTTAKKALIDNNLYDETTHRLTFTSETKAIVLTLAEKAGVEVELAHNAHSSATKDGGMLRGTISNVEVKDGKISFTIDNSKWTAHKDFGLTYNLTQDAEGDSFYISSIKNTGEKTYYVNGDWAKNPSGRVYTLTNGLLELDPTAPCLISQYKQNGTYTILHKDQTINKAGYVLPEVTSSAQAE